jgi:hypothetical protein
LVEPRALLLLLLLRLLLLLLLLLLLTRLHCLAQLRALRLPADGHHPNQKNTQQGSPPST